MTSAERRKSPRHPVDLPEAGVVEVTGRVIRLAEGEGDPRGLAVLFTHASSAAANRIDLFLSKL